MNTAEAYEKVTARMIALLEAGTVPWQKPWQAAEGGFGGLPVSAHGHKYRGINLLILMAAGYSSPVWLTFNQAKKLGGAVKRGEKGTPVLLWRRGRTYTAESASGEPEERRGFYATTFTVFNAEQCEGLPEGLAVAPEPVPAAEIVADYLNDGGPMLSFGGDRAYYSPSGDGVRLPPVSAFKTNADMMATLFHELVHSTGHEKRLARGFGKTFGDHKYSKEELIAELGAAFLCARAGIANPELEANSAAYLRNWLTVLKGEPKMLVQAASAAQKAVDHILNEELAAAVTSEAAGESEAA
jgi:antirestriction protein ArdC